MKKKLSTLLAISALAFCLNACSSDDLINGSPGKSTKTVTSVDESGTTTERQSTIEIGVDEHGNKKSVVKSLTTTNLKGSPNKTTTGESMQEVEEKR